MRMRSISPIIASFMALRVSGRLRVRVTMLSCRWYRTDPFVIRELLGNCISQAQEIMPILERVPSLIVFDHLAHIPQPEGVNHPLYAKVRALMDRGRTWVKLSGAYADTKVGPPTYADSSAVARAYAKAVPERCVWGSDWPHPSEQSKHLPDDAVLFDLLSDWVPDEKVRHRVLVENPATLYDFPKGA